MNSRIKELYDIIRVANEELKEIRGVCSHTLTEQCNYEISRPGNLHRAEVCSDCGEYIKYLSPFPFPIIEEASNI